MATPFPPNVHVSTHPCLRAKISQVRSSSTNARDTQTLLHDIATILGCEALAHGLTTDDSHLGHAYTTESISPSHICLVPILRSGLSMLPALTALLPDPVPIHHLGMYREKTTFQPVEYYNNLPYHKAGATANAARASDIAIVVDPIIATGSTVCAAIETLRDWGVQRIIALAVLASDAGLRRAAEAWPEGVEVWVGAVDMETNDKGFLVPGVGDIGDRLFLTVGK